MRYLPYYKYKKKKMGQKGDKMTSQSVLTTALILEKLAWIENITSKRMFGGHGIFHNGKMFGMVDSKGTAFLKAGDTNRMLFENAGLKRHSKMPYYELLQSHLDDAELLSQWAKKSIEISKE